MCEREFLQNVPYWGGPSLFCTGHVAPGATATRSVFSPARPASQAERELGRKAAGSGSAPPRPGPRKHIVTNRGLFIAGRGEVSAVNCHSAFPEKAAESRGACPDNQGTKIQKTRHRKERRSSSRGGDVGVGAGSRSPAPPWAPHSWPGCCPGPRSPAPGAPLPRGRLLLCERETRPSLLQGFYSVWPCPSPSCGGTEVCAGCETCSNGGSWRTWGKPTPKRSARENARIRGGGASDASPQTRASDTRSPPGTLAPPAWPPSPSPK